MASAIWAAYMNLWERRQREIAEGSGEVKKLGRPKKESGTAGPTFRSETERRADNRFYERMGKLKETGRMLVGEREIAKANEDVPMGRPRKGQEKNTAAGGIYSGDGDLPFSGLCHLSPRGRRARYGCPILPPRGAGSAPDEWSIV